MMFLGVTLVRSHSFAIGPGVSGVLAVRMSSRDINAPTKASNHMAVDFVINDFHEGNYVIEY